MTIFGQVSLLISLSVVLLTATAFLLSRGIERNRSYDQLQAVLQSKAALIERAITIQREQVALLGQDESLTRLPALSKLVGFDSVLIVKKGETPRLIAGSAPRPETIAAIEGMPLTTRTTVTALYSRGIQVYVILTPMKKDSSAMLTAIFRIQPLLTPLFDVRFLGNSADITLGIPHGSETLIFHGNAGLAVWQEAVNDVTLSAPLQLALDRRSGVMQTMVGGFPALAAYQAILPFGWGLSITLNESELYQPANSMALSLLLAGLALTSVLALIMLRLSRRITSPLHELISKLDGLEARGWKYHRSIFTGDELGALDGAALDLTRRLKDAHVYLESVVRSRTRELTQQHAQDEAIFQSIEYGLLVTDKQGKIILMNSAAEQLTGWSMKAVIGRRYDSVLRIIDKNLHPIEKARHPVTTVLRLKKHFVLSAEAQFSLLHHDGKIVPLSLRVTPIMHGKRRMGSVAVFRDTTEDRRIDRMKSDFISLVSHQLRTPLSAIRWYLELLLSPDAGTLKPIQKSYVAQISESNNRMVRLVDALLNVSRIELKKFEPSVRRIDVRIMLEELQKTYAKDIAEKRLSMHYRSHSASAWTLEADTVLLQLILENLLNNAIKYSRREGMITVDFSRQTTDKTATIAVTDEGIGIPMPQQKHVFEKLFRADNARQSDTNGNGLGLYISHLAADTIGGSLQFISQENRGTTVSLTLPLKAKKGKK